MSLSELLALLPDNTTGDISAADLRTIVSDLYEAANTHGSVHAYRWDTSGSAPATGRISTDVLWSMSATKVRVSETTDDGLTVGFGALDSAASRRCRLAGPSGAVFEADITGASVDLGTYRELPITPTSVTGPAPTNAAAITAAFLVTMA